MTPDDEEKEREEKSESNKESSTEESASETSIDDDTVYIDSDDEEYTASEVDALPSSSASLSNSITLPTFDTSEETFQLAQTMIETMIQNIPPDVAQSFTFMTEMEEIWEQQDNPSTGWTSTGSTSSFRILFNGEANVVDQVFSSSTFSVTSVPSTSVPSDPSSVDGDNDVLPLSFIQQSFAVGFLPQAMNANVRSSTAASHYPLVQPIVIPEIPSLPSRFSNPLSAAQTLSTLSELDSPLRPSRPRWGTLIGSHARLSRRRRLFSHGATSVVLLGGVSFSEDEYELAEQCFTTMIWEHSEELEDEFDFISPSENVMNLMLEIWHANRREGFPTFDELTQALIREIISNTDVPIDLNEMYDIVQHYLREDGSLPHHNDFIHVYEFILLHDEYPTHEQLIEMNRRTVAFFMNPEQYHARDKMLVPALNVDKIPRYTNADDGVVCSVCQDDIAVGQIALKLPPCNHAFHANDTDCLGEGSIVKWLAENNKCPMCKSKVEVPLNSN